MFFRLATSVGLRKNSESPWGIEPQTFRLHGEQDLFHFLQRSVLAKYWLMLETFVPSSHRHSVYMSMGSKSRVSAELLARYQRSSVSVLWRQLVIGQSNDITRRWGFPTIKVISTKTSVIRERQNYIFVWCLTQVLDLTIGPRHPEYVTAH